MNRELATAEISYDIIFDQFEPHDSDVKMDLELMDESESIRQLRDLVSEATEPPPFVYTTC